MFSRKEEKDFSINVNFNEVLNLRKYIFYDSNPYIYELIGVINILNEFKEEKQFISFIKNSTDKKWYLYEDDNQVLEVKFKDIKEKGKVNVLIYNCIDSI